jgi:D-beta-D-heptose 7-phosphate kinase/D-beta-D-heptose 1-phosphate adenosyltransferase
MIDRLFDVMRGIEHEWSSRRLLVVGDVMLDKYIWGEVRRISPEAPVPLVRVVRQSEQPGGAANVAMNIARFGTSPMLVGFAGLDENRELLDAALKVNGISAKLVESDGFPTITKMRILGGGQQMLRLDSERLGNRSPKDYERLLETALDQLPAAEAMVLSDYAKGVLSPGICKALIAEARRLRIPVLVDPKTDDFSRYRGATTICPNLGELSSGLNMGAYGGDLETLLTSAEGMIAAFDLDFLTATLSEKGIALIRPGNRMVIPALARQVFDVSGAGDTVIAVMALALAGGLNPETAVHLANVAAGIVVGKVGTVPIEKHELLAALAPAREKASYKVVSREELVKRIVRWRGNGEKIAFTYGCFDLLHAGHISLLEQAGRSGDRLIVGLEGDASVRELRGPGRPLVAQGDRARVLAALAAVDAVVIFDEPTPLDLIRLVQPDVIVRGANQPDAVKGWGGQVRVVPTLDGYSTDGLLKGATTS